MPTGKVRLNFNRYKKKYEYPITVKDPTPHEIALEVSKQVLGQQIKRGMKRQSGGLPCYNLVLDLIRKQNVRFNMPEDITSSKEQCFMKAKFANEQSPWAKVECCDNPECEKCKGQGEYYIRNVYRVGKNTSKQLIVETDNQDIENAKLIKNHFESFFQYEFSLIKTAHGYHIIGEKCYDNIQDWLYANCCVLSPHLQKCCMGAYIKQIIDLDTKMRKNYSQDFKNLFIEEIKSSKLYAGVGDFDILYTVLSIKYKKATLRISKKQKNDNYEEVI